MKAYAKLLVFDRGR